MNAIRMLGTLSTGQPIVSSLLAQCLETVAAYGPIAVEILRRPNRINRLGDLLVWDGEGGRKIIAGLDGVGENVNRINSAVAGIETAQLATNGILNTLQTVSFATLGVTALSAGYMFFRLKALDARVSTLNQKIADVENQVAAEQRARLLSAIQFIRGFESKSDNHHLEEALGFARMAANTYAQLAQGEARGQRRLPVLNYHGRCYLLSLMTEVRALLLMDDSPQASERICEEQPTLVEVARATFEKTIGQSPEDLLDPGLRVDGITLELLAETYRQAYQAGAIGDPEIRDAAEMFEHLRDGIYRSRSRRFSLFASSSRDGILARFRYLIACVEDVNRVKALQLLIDECQQRKTTLRHIESQLHSWRSRLEPNQLLAFDFGQMEDG